MDKFITVTQIRKGTALHEPGPSSSVKSVKRAPPAAKDEPPAKKQTLRKFQESWKVGREWLVYDRQKQLMFCKVCAAHEDVIDDYRLKVLQKDGNFIGGTNNFRKSAITDHEKSRVHLKTASVHAAQQLANQREASAAGKALLQLKEKERDRLRLLYRNAHAIAKKNKPLTDLAWMTELDVAKGLDVGTTYVGTTYRNNKACGEFIDTMAAVEASNVVADVQASNHFSLTMDGTTDVSSTEQETLFIRFVKKGEVTTKFLKIAEPASTQSVHLHQLVKDIIAETGLTSCMDKFVGFGCDGAANMLGKQKGVATLLQREYPSIIVVHCLAHRLELAYKDAVKRSTPKQYDRVVTLLVGLYYMFKNSSKQRKLLKETFRVHNVKALMPPRVGGTHWLGHMMRAIGWLFRAYGPVVDCLCDASHYNAKAEGLVKLLTNSETLAYLLLLKDLLEPLAHLSLWLQKPSAALSEVSLILETTMDMVTQLKNRNGTELQELLDTEGEAYYKGHKLRGAVPTMKYKAPFLDAVLQCLASRFSDLDSPIVASTRIASLRQWPASMSEEFGEEEVVVLVKHFYGENGPSVDEVLSDWRVLRSLMYRSYGKKINEQQWEDVNRAMDGMPVAAALRVIDLCLALPPTSVANETAFNQMKLIKTDRRHRLSQKRLDSIMMVRINGPSIAEFDPDKAIDRWLVTPRTRRRPNYRRRQQADGVAGGIHDASGAACEESEELSVPADGAVDVSHQKAQDSESESDMESDEEDVDGDLGYESFEEQDFNENGRMIAKYRAELA